MLDPDYLNAAGEMTAAVYTQIESEMLEYLTKRMIEGDITNQRSQTALLLLSQSNSQGLLAILNSHKGEISASVSKEVSDALKRSDADDLKRIKKGMGVELPSITSRQIAATVAGVRDILARENLNMVQSAQTAFLTQSIWAITQVNTGAMTTEKALHSAVRKLEGEGISLISYRNTKTGRQTVQNKVDVAIRRHIRTQILQDSMRRTEQILDDAGVELVEVSSHGGARPSHAEWEGRVYSRNGDKVIDGIKYKDFKTACKWGDVADGIGGANCRHSYSAYFPGMKRMYKPDPKHPSGKSNAEVYDLTQKQRAYERDIRDAKRELSGAEQLYKDNPTLENQAEAAKAKLKLQNKQAKMRELINDNPGILQRSPRREWAGDMPKVKVPKASGRKIDDFLEAKSKQLKKAGISKTKMKSALSTELGELGLKTEDFSKLTAKDQVGLFEKIKNSIDAKLPSTKKALAGKHARKVSFTPAKSVAEAEEYARKHFEATANYKGISLEAANGLNRSIAEHIEQFPRLKEQIRFVGSEQERNKAAKAHLANWIYEQNRGTWAAMGLTDAEMKSKAKKWASKKVGKCGREWAQSLSVSNSDSPWQEFTGITLNQKHFSEKNLATTKESMASAASEKTKWHPEGAGTPKGTYDHEVGHQLDHLLGISEDPEFLLYINQLEDNDIIENLSRYAAPTKGRPISQDHAEFIAEAWSEYRNNPNPRKHATFIGKLVLKRYSEIR